jgi:HPC2 and ubinuclein domain
VVGRPPSAGLVPSAPILSLVFPLARCLASLFPSSPSSAVSFIRRKLVGASSCIANPSSATSAVAPASRSNALRLLVAATRPVSAASAVLAGVPDVVLTRSPARSLMDAGHGVDDSGIMSNSSEPLSSPPGSPDLVAAPAGLPASTSIANSLRNGFSGVAAAANPTSAPNVASTTDKPPPKKTTRRKKELTEDDLAAKAVKEQQKKPARKPRAPRDPNAPPPASRKRIKLEVAQPGTGTSTSTGTAAVAPPPPPPANTGALGNALLTATSQSSPRQPTKISDLVSSDPPPPPQLSARIAGQGTPTQRPASSGQMFDIIRGSVIEAPPASPTPVLQNRASASPSIKSLIDPQPQPMSVQASRVSINELSGNPAASKPRTAAAPATSASIASPVPTKSLPAKPSEQTAEESKPPARRVESSTHSGPPSSAPTPPKTQRLREPPPLPSGSGLLSGTALGVGAVANGTKTGPVKGTNIWLSFALKGKENVTINISHEIESKYGTAALNPRLAERKERRRQIDLAGAELERAAGLTAEGDDMSLDLNSDAESGNDGSDAVMRDAPSKSEPEVKKRKRRAEDYDRNDDFIDDTEMRFEEQALMAKDGFFVYSGPLIQEGEKPAVERYVISLFSLSILTFTVPMVLWSLDVVADVAEAAEVVQLATVDAELVEEEEDPAAAQLQLFASPESPKLTKRPWSKRSKPGKRQPKTWLAAERWVLLQLLACPPKSW